MRISSSVFCILSVCSWLFWFNTPATGQTAPLQPTTTDYYTVVSTAFGGLSSSYSYHEYGTTDLQRWYTIGRYYAPDTTEYTDVNANAYYLWLPPLPGQNPNCVKYPLSQAQQILWGGANAFLVNLTNEQLQFPPPVTATVRTQTTYQYTYSTSYEIVNGREPAASTSINTFLQLAYATAGVSNSPPYSVSVTVNVYFLANSNGLIMTGDGATPLRFTITGTRVDINKGETRNLNFVQDFMQWAQLDTKVWTKPSSACTQTNTNPAVLPTIPQTPSLGKRPQGLLQVPAWTGGRAYVEITSSDTTYPFLQVYSFVDLKAYLTTPGIGQEIATVVNNSNTFIWNNYLYVYTNASVPNNYDTGTIYLIIDDEFIVPEINQVKEQTTCQNGPISASHFSPLQWLNGGSLLTIFQNTGFLNSATFMNNPQVIRGYTADWWHASNLISYCVKTQTTYTFDLDIYAVQTPASGWANLGRTLLDNSSPNWPQQLLQLSYTGNKSDGTSYTLLMDFFVQHPEPFLDDTSVLNPGSYPCSGGSQNIQDARKNVALSVSSSSFEPVNVNDKSQSSVQNLSSVTVSSGPSVGSFGLGISIFVASMAATVVGVAKFGSRKWNFRTALGKYFSPAEQQKKTQ